MSLRKPISVQKKMTGIIFLVSMLVMVLTSAQFYFIERQHMKSVARDDIASLGALVSFNARSYMALNDYAGVKNTLESLSIRKDVVTAYLFKPDGLSRVGYSRAQKIRTQTTLQKRSRPSSLKPVRLKKVCNRGQKSSGTKLDDSRILCQSPLKVVTLVIATSA